LVWANGYTEAEIAKLLGIHIENWNRIAKGITRTSNSLQVALSGYLGDEVFELFLGMYIDTRLERIVPANDYDPNRVGRKMKEKMNKILKEGKELKYG